jgi:hypothetical protein
MPFDDPVVCLEVCTVGVDIVAETDHNPNRLTAKASTMFSKALSANGQPKKGMLSRISLKQRFDLFLPLIRRFPVVAGLRIKWDHTKPPGQRVVSVHLIKNAAPNGDDPEDEYENPEDLVKFFEQEDGTRVEVRQRNAILGEEVKRDDTSRTYRLVSLS